MKLPHRSLRLLAACARTAAVSTLARYTAPATVCGAPCRRVLCLGDGDLSCSAALADAGVDVTSTTLDTRDDLHRKYGEEAAARFDRLGAVGGVDATRPPDFGGAFDRVIFNFPHAPGKQNIRRNRELLHAVCAAADIAPGGELLIALDGGQGGCAGELPQGQQARREAWNRSWQLDVAAAENGLVVAEATPFEPFYGTRGHRGEGKARAFAPRAAVLHSLARTGTAAAVSAPSYVFEVQFFSDNADDDVAVCDALRRAAGGLAHAVRRADRYERADGRVSHAFEVTLATREACLPRSQADIVRQTVETEIEELLGVRLRTEKTGRLVSKPLPWPES